MTTIFALLAFAFFVYLLLLAITPNTEAGIHTAHHSTLEDEQ